jgi:hypothetical protein
MRFSARGTQADGKTGRRRRLRRPAVAAAAIAGVLAVAGLPAAASAATQAPYKAATYSAGTRAAATCAPTRPHSDTILYKGITGGLGELTIENGLSRDGVVVLVLGRSRAIGVYVRAHATATVGNIKNGTYTVYFTTGSQYRTCTGRFSSGASYQRFSDSLPYHDTPPEYTIWTMTLQPVPNGNAPSTPISPPDFPAP